MAALEVDELTVRDKDLEKRLQILLLPKDPNDDKNILVEVRGGAGGDESNLFAADLLRMYTRYAALRGWKAELLNYQETELGGVKEVVLSIKGEGVYRQIDRKST